MRFSWFVTAGVCAWLVSCGGSGHKKALVCDAAECGPDEVAGASDAGPENEPDASAAGVGGTGAEAGMPGMTDFAAGAAGVAGIADAAGASGDDSALTIIIHGNGSVAVAGASACLSSRCSYPGAAGTRFALQAKAGADSRFSGWSGDCSGMTANVSVKLNGPVSCIASFVTEHSVAASVTAAGGGSVHTDPDLACGALGCSGEVDDHSQITLTASPLSGFRFVGWSGSPECAGQTPAALAIEVTRDLNCQASFAKQFTLKVSALGTNAPVGVKSGACDALECTADAGASAAFHAANAAGFRFTGWSGDAACTGTVNPLQIAAITSDVSCVANYAARRMASGVVAAGFSGNVVASSANVNAVCTGNSCSLDAGTTATLLAPTIAGSRLTGWSGAGCLLANQNGNGITVTPTTSDVTCTANYAQGVSVGGSVVGATGTVVATSSSPGASCAAGSCGIDAGGSVTLTAPNLVPAYRFTGWTGDAGCASASLSVTVSNVTSSKTCQANYIQQFTIAGVAGPGGTVSAKNAGVSCVNNSCTVDAGSSVSLSATPDTVNGYHFVAWSGAGCAPAAGNPLQLSNINATCTANFALNTFTIAATAGTNGSVTATRSDTGALCAGSSCTVNFGTTVSLAATPAPNYHFAGWSGAGCTPAASTTLALKNINASCSAAFAINTFTASVSATPTPGGTVGITCPGNCAAVPYGQLVNLTATANTGWSFGSWSANCGGGNASPTSVTILGNTACVASFRPRVTGVVAPTGAGAIGATGTPNAQCVNGDPASCIVDLGGSVTLVARPAANAVFSGWTGDCTGTSATLTLTTIGAPKNCTANFYELWAQATGGKANDGMARLVALGDGTLVGLGPSFPETARLPRLALVDLDANTGRVGRNQVFEDSLKTGQFAALGLAVTANQKNVIALGVHAVSQVGTRPWLHNEQTPKWEAEYTYSGGGNASGLGGEVITTLDSGYAFTIAINDPQLGVALTHLTHVDGSGKPTFDVAFCAPNPNGACLPTVPVDLLQDPTTKNYVVLSQVQDALYGILLSFVSEAGTLLGSTRYSDIQDLRPAQFVMGSSAESYAVVGTRTDAKLNSDGFFAELTRAQKAPSLAVAIGSAAADENLLGITRSATGYALSGTFTDAKAGNEAWFLLLDQAAGIKLQLAYGGAGAESANALTLMPGGGFALGGVTSSWGAGGNDMWTLRVDANGALTFNAASGAQRYATAFTRVALTSITSPTSPSLKRDSTATQVSAAVTAQSAGFSQVAQAP